MIEGNHPCNGLLPTQAQHETYMTYQALYEKDIAVGSSDIRNDKVVFRFKKETFEFPTVELVGKMEWNGYFYTMKVDRLRKLAQEKRHG